MRRFLLIVPILLLLFALWIPIGVKLLRARDILTTPDFIARDLVARGVRIQEVWKNDLLPAGVPKSYPDSPAALKLLAGARTVRLTSLSQIDGLVAIHSRLEALEFVRLRQHPWCWPPPEEREVQISNNGSEGNGLVSAAAFKAAGFSPPSVRSESKGKGGPFLIYRWLFVTHPAAPAADCVEKVEEQVTAHGGYTRKVLLTEPPPAVRGALWTVTPLD